MSRPHDGHRPFFPFGNHFKAFRSKGAYPTTKLVALQNAFEEALAEQLVGLKPKEISDVLSFSWMKTAASSLCEVHTKIKDLIADLKFPVSEWDEEWMDMYLDNSVKLLDLCNFFSSEISRHEQGLLLLRYITHVLNPSSTSSTVEERLKRANGPLCEWSLQVGGGSKSAKLESTASTLKSLAASVNLKKTKNLTKGKVLMRAMYGVKAITVFICGILSSVLTGSLDLLMDASVATECLWFVAFEELRGCIHSELRLTQSLRNTLTPNELAAVQQTVHKIATDIKLNEELLKANTVSQESALVLHQCVSEMGENTEKLADGLECLSKEVREFFHIVLTGRDALLCSLRTEGKQSNNSEKMRF